MKKTYYAAVDGFIHGAVRSKGDPIKMTEGEAKYPRMSGLVTTTPPVAAPIEEPRAPGRKSAKSEAR